MNASASTRKKLWRALPLAVSAAALGGLGVESAEAQCMYEIVAEITAPGCPPIELAPIPTAINDHGVVVGYFYDCAFNEQPFTWSAETGFVAIPLPPSVTRAQPMDVNNNGEIVGSLFRPGIGETHAFHWEDGIWTELPSLAGFPVTQANAINDRGEIVGDAFDPVNGPRRALFWNGRELTELDLPIGRWSRANDINNSSMITGWMAEMSSSPVAFLLIGSRVENIGVLPRGTTGVGRKLNRDGVLLGEGQVKLRSGTTVIRSFVATSSDDKIELGTLPGSTFTRPSDINDVGQVVGRCHTSANGSDVPFLWQHEQILELQTLIDEPPEGLNLDFAYAANSAGQIVVAGSDSPVFVLSPVNQPLGDTNFDCLVDERDLIAVLEDWGPGKSDHPTDMVTSATFQPPGDGRVDAADLAVVLGNWSP